METPENDNIHITLILADRPYRLKIKPEEEEQIRNAAKVVNEQLRTFQQSYDAKDKQDYLAMSALHFSVELTKSVQSLDAVHRDVDGHLALIEQRLESIQNDSE